MAEVAEFGAVGELDYVCADARPLGVLEAAAKVQKVEAGVVVKYWYLTDAKVQLLADLMF